MAHKFSISFLFFLLPLLFPLSHSSPFEFLKNLQGSQKGDIVQGLSDLKQYLKMFGYINNDQEDLPPNQDDDNENDRFDEILESAIKTYQQNYHLEATGKLDAQTVYNMMLPRCGVADIIDGHSRMRSSQNKMHNRKLIVSHYQFFSGSPKWPNNKINLTYNFAPGTSPDAITAISGAFDKWAGVTQFTFINVQDVISFENPDIRIGFYSGDHGDGSPFDGPFGVLAHASAPTSGSFHLDADEPWSVNGPVPGRIDMETVALHEIGHLLGLQHSSVKDAIMYPSVADGETKELCGDDVQGISELYNNV